MGAVEAIGYGDGAGDGGSGGIVVAQAYGEAVYFYGFTFGQGGRGAAAKRGAPPSGRQGSHKGAQGSAKKSGSGASKRSGSRTLAKSAQMLSQDTRRTKKSKLDRVFGDDAARILREADRMVGGNGKKRKNSR